MSEGQRVRYMRLLVFFDLPVETAMQRKEYRIFRKYLIKEGFLMLQESVYVKLATSENVANAIISRLKKNRPPHGLCQVLRVTEKQYATMSDLTGESRTVEALDTTEKLVVL